MSSSLFLLFALLLVASQAESQGWEKFSEPGMDPARYYELWFAKIPNNASIGPEAPPSFLSDGRGDSVPVVGKNNLDADLNGTLDGAVFTPATPVLGEIPPGRSPLSLEGCRDELQTEKTGFQTLSLTNIRLRNLIGGLRSNLTESQGELRDCWEERRKIEEDHKLAFEGWKICNTTVDSNNVTQTLVDDLTLAVTTYEKRARSCEEKLSELNTTYYGTLANRSYLIKVVGEGDNLAKDLKKWRDFYQRLTVDNCPAVVASYSLAPNSVARFAADVCFEVALQTRGN